MEVRTFWIVRRAVVSRVAVRYPRVPRIVQHAVEPAPAAHIPVGQAVRHGAAAIRSGRIPIRADAVVVRVVPVVHPLPHVSRHVVDAPGIGATGSLHARLRARPPQLHLGVELPVVEPHGRRPRIRSGLEGIVRVRSLIRVLRIRPVGLGIVLVVAPGEVEIRSVLAPARGVLPLRFGRQPVARFREIHFPGSQVVTRRQPLLLAQPVRIRRSAAPADTHRMVRPIVHKAEFRTVPRDAAVVHHRVRLHVEIRAALAIDQPVAHLDGPLRICRIQELDVLAVGDVVRADVHRIDPHHVQRTLIARMLGVHEVVVVPHLEFAGREQRDLRIFRGTRLRGLRSRAERCQQQRPYSRSHRPPHLIFTVTVFALRPSTFSTRLSSPLPASVRGRGPTFT